MIRAVLHENRRARRDCRRRLLQLADCAHSHAPLRDRWLPAAAGTGADSVLRLLGSAGRRQQTQGYQGRQPEHAMDREVEHGHTYEMIFIQTDARRSALMSFHVATENRASNEPQNTT